MAMYTTWITDKNGKRFAYKLPELCGIALEK